MQQEIDAANPTTPIRILGVNAAGYEIGNDSICFGRFLPWLQDTAAQDVWGRWSVTWRDVVILDQDNQVLRAYNLTAHDLGNPSNYAELKSMLLNAAP
jgi:hypothetical protein